MRHSPRSWWIALACVVAVLVGLRAALPGWTLDRLNARLERLGSYHGEVEDLDLHLWAGSYTLYGVTVTKRSDAVPVPFFSAPRIDFSLAWSALLHGAVVAEADFYRPELNFVDLRGDDNQTGQGVHWRRRLESLAPIRVNEIRVHDGTVHFRNFFTKPAVDQQATHVNGRVRNLTNVRDRGDRAADFDLTAQVLGEAPMHLSGSANPFAVLEDFHFQMKIDSMDLTRLNETLRAYANLDVESGQGQFVMELAAKDGRLEGYAKPLFDRVEIFSWQHDIEQQGDNPLHALWEALSGALEDLFKNQQENQFATRIEIQGDIGDPQTSTLEAIAGVLKNAFVEAYRFRFEDLPERPEQQTTGSS